MGRVLSRRRWEKGDFSDASLLRTVRRWARTEPDDTQAYGHLRPPGAREAEPVAA